MKRFQPGAMRPGLLDILTALILLAILVWASWMQFPAYSQKFRPNPAASAPAARPSG